MGLHNTKKAICHKIKTLFDISNMLNHSILHRKIVSHYNNVWGNSQIKYG